MFYTYGDFLSLFALTTFPFSVFSLRETSILVKWNISERRKMAVFITGMYVIICDILVKGKYN